MTGSPILSGVPYLIDPYAQVTSIEGHVSPSRTADCRYAVAVLPSSQELPHRGDGQLYARTLSGCCAKVVVEELVVGDEVTDA